MARVLITGAADGLGRAAAAALQDQGHHVVVHARCTYRLNTVPDLLAQAAGSIVGDLADLDQVQDLVQQANSLGPFDAVIHNAGILDGPALLPVNVVAPYVLTAGIKHPGRLIYLSSSMHRGGKPTIQGADWSGTHPTRSYSDSKLFLTTIMAAVARYWPTVPAHAVDPGWVPTKMGGPSASDDLQLGHVTQTWLATTDSREALLSGRYWHHLSNQEPHHAVQDEQFQDNLIASLAEHTGIELPRR